MGEKIKGYRHHFVSLRIFGKIPDFDAITKHLGVKPDHMHRKGERRTHVSAPYRDDAWVFTISIPKSRSLENHLLGLHRRLVRKTRHIKQLARTHKVDLYCSYHSNYDRGNLEFPAEIVKWCGDLGIPIRASVLVLDI